jgi:acyl-CoA thioester hydrolase
MDAFRHVNNANYLTFCEIARTEYWKKKIKWDWNKMGIIIARVEIDYLKPLTLKDKLIVHVRTSKVGNKSFELEYILTSKLKDQQIIHASASTVCVCIDYKNNTTAPIPSKYKQIMEKEVESILSS